MLVKCLTTRQEKKLYLYVSFAESAFMLLFCILKLQWCFALRENNHTINADDYFYNAYSINII
jgi:hypothetical protein